MQSGELIVTGTNSVVIPLRGFPSEVRAYFKDNGFSAVPCDPGNADTIEYEIRSSNTVKSGFILFITWQVSSVREVKWHAAY